MYCTLLLNLICIFSIYNDQHAQCSNEKWIGDFFLNCINLEKLLIKLIKNKPELIIMYMFVQGLKNETWT